MLSTNSVEVRPKKESNRRGVAQTVSLAIYSDNAEISTLLESWRGCRGEIWTAHPTFRRLGLCLSRSDDRALVYLVCLGCKNISGKFSWQSGALRIDRQREKATLTVQENGRTILKLHFDGGVTAVLASEGEHHPYLDDDSWRRAFEGIKTGILTE